MMRSSVVLPEPDGPSSATSSPAAIVERNAVQRRRLAESLDDVLDRDVDRARPSASDGVAIAVGKSHRRACASIRSPQWRRVRGDLVGVAPFESVLTTRVTRASSASSEATAKAAAKSILVVEDLDLQRHGVGLAADVAGDHRHRAELAHGAGVAEQHAVEQRPFDVGQRHPEEGLPAAGAERQRRLLVAACPAPASAGSARARRRGR